MLRNEEIVSFFEEDKTNRKFFANFKIVMKLDEDGIEYPEKLECTRVKEMIVDKSYLTFGNPQFLSKDKIAFEAWNPLRYTSAESHYIYQIDKDGVISDQAYDIIECLKTDLIFDLKVIEEDTFCVFSNKKIKVFMSGKEQL